MAVLRLRRVFLTLVCIIIWSELGEAAFAATHSWSGAGTTNKWSDAGNWKDNVVPQHGDLVVFGANVPQATNVYDLPASVVLVTISFAENVTVTGGPIAVRDAIGVTVGSTVALNCPLVLAGKNFSNGVSIAVEQNALLSIHGVISGDIPFFKKEVGTLRLEGEAPNTFGGAARADAGTLVLEQTNGVAIPNGINIGGTSDPPGSAVVLMDGDDQIAGDVLIERSGVWNF